MSAASLGVPHCFNNIAIYYTTNPNNEKCHYQKNIINCKRYFIFLQQKKLEIIYKL